MTDLARAGLSAALAAALAASAATIARAAEATSDTVHIARAPAPPSTDAGLSDPVWKLGVLDQAIFENLTTRKPAAFPTTISILTDDKDLYVAFRCAQPGIPITATQSTNDVGFGSDDFVGVGLDTSGNGTQVYFFETTPRGIRYQQASETVRYKPQWRASASVAGDGWNAAMVIPLDALRIHSGAQNWRINFVRGIAATGDHYSWAFNGLMQDAPIPPWPAAFDARYWPSVVDLHVAAASHDVRPRPHAEFYGLDSLGLDRNTFQQANGSFANESIRHAGLDATFPITNTANLIATVNPDFSNVEVDQVAIAPTEFQRNLQEYRPFFAQGANFVDANGAPIGTAIGQPAVIFYSPGIGTFDWGAKAEGTFGKQSFGVVNFRGYDQTSGNTFDDVAYGLKHAEASRSFVYWLDGAFAHHSLSGTDATNEIGVGSRNVAGGFLALADAAVEQGSWVPLTGIAHSSYAFVDEQKPNYEVNLGYQDQSPNYDPLDGITPNSDLRGPNGYVSFNGTTSALKSWNFNVIGDRLTDHSGAVHQADAIISGAVTFKDQISLYNLGTQIGQLRYYEIPGGPNCAGPPVAVTFFTGYPCYAGGQTHRFTLYGGAIGYRDGTPAPIDFSLAAGPFGPNYLHQFTWATSRPIGQHLSLSLEYDGTDERPIGGGALDSQWVRRVSIGDSISANSNVSIAFRSINGAGGFALPGVNVAASYHRILANGSEIFLNFGTPAARATLDRFVVKYVIHAGGGAGT